MSYSLARRTFVAAGSTGIAAALLLSLPHAADAATYRAYGGSAYDSLVKVGTLANSGKTSYVPMCTTKAGYTKTNNTGAVNLPGVASIGVATTKVHSAKSGSTQTSTTTTKTGATSLLGGLVTADALTTTATAKHSTSGYSTSGSSVFTNLRIGTLAVSAKPKANTKVTIPGIASVTLNAQSTATSSGQHARSVTALKVTLLSDNTLGLPAGSIVVGYAKASLHAPTHNRPYGNAFGTELAVGNVVKSGATAAVYLPCGGSSGTTRRNDVAGVSVPGVLSVGAVTTYAKSSDSSSSTSATTGAKTGRVNLLNGVVTLEAVTAQAKTTRKGHSVSRSSSGTKVVGLKINGVTRTVSTKENTKISIAGVGDLYLRRAVRTSTGIQVYAAQLKLTTDVGSADAGTTLSVGAAKAGVSYH